MADRVRITTVPTTRRAAPNGMIYMEKAGRVVVRTSNSETTCTLSLLPAASLELANMLTQAAFAAENGDPFDRSLAQT